MPGHKISGYSISVFPAPYKRKARRILPDPADSVYPLALIIKTAEQLPPPTPAPALRLQPQAYIGPRRQGESQAAQGTSSPIQRQQIPPRGQKPEDVLLQRGPGPSAAPVLRTEGQPVPDTGRADSDAHPAQDITCAQAEIFLSFPFPQEEEGTADNYCSSLALTRYWPPTTPPKRYFPSALVLVTAISVSLAADPVPVT